MAIPNSTWTEVISAALYERRREFVDSVLNHDPFLAYMRANGRVDPADGGVALTEQISYSGNTGYQRYTGFETLGVGAYNVLTSAQYEWKQSAIPIALSGLELRQVNGRNQVIDLMRSKIENANNEFANSVADDIFSDGLADGGKQIGGMQLLIADDPTTGTVGGINRANWTFWRSTKFGGVADGGGAVSATNIQGYMNQLTLNTAVSNDRPDIWVKDANYYRFFWESLQAIQRITSERDAGAGFENLSYFGPRGRQMVMFDGSCPANHSYLVNTRFIRFRPHRDANFSPSGEKQSVNQDAVVVHVLLQANMTMSKARGQGVLIA